jgi:hypothetical protein
MPIGLEVSIFFFYLTNIALNHKYLNKIKKSAGWEKPTDYNYGKTNIRTGMYINIRKILGKLNLFLMFI